MSLGMKSRRLSAPPKSSAAYPLDELYANPYWGRLWVAQEIMLAQDWIVLHGYKAIRGDEILDSLWNQDTRIVGPAIWIRNRTEFQFRDTPPDLKTVLMCFAHLKCEDPRDKIYALLSLARDTHDVIIDYAGDPEVIFWSAFWLHSRMRKRLSIHPAWLTSPKTWVSSPKRQSEWAVIVILEKDGMVVS
jgi:hypothetical protein